MYYPNEEEIERFEDYIYRNDIEDEREIRELWRDYCEELEEGVAFNF